MLALGSLWLGASIWWMFLKPGSEAGMAGPVVSLTLMGLPLVFAFGFARLAKKLVKEAAVDTGTSEDTL